MEDPENQHKRSTSLLTPLRRYYAAIQLLSSVHPRVYRFLYVYQSLQFASLLIPPTDEWEVPWNYSVFWPVWLCLNCVARVDRLLILVFGNAEIVVFLCLGLIAMRTISTGACLSIYATMGTTQYQLFVTGQSPSLWKRGLVTADRLFYLLFSQIVTVTIFAFLASELSCSRPGVCLSEQHTWSYLLSMTALPFATCVVVCDRIASCDVQWHSHTNSMSRPQQALVLVGFDLLTAVLLGGMHFAERKLYSLGIAGILGVGKLMYVMRERPFHSEEFNTAAAFQGGFLLCQSLLLCISIFFDASGLMPSLSFFLVSPMLACFLYSRLKKPEERVHSGVIHSVWQQEMTLRSVVLSGTFDEANPRSIGMWTNNSEVMQLIWSAYFYLAKKEFFCMKMLIAQMSSKRLSALLWVASEVCFCRMRISLNDDPDEKAIIDFVRLIRMQDKVSRQDYDSTLKLRRFYEKLLHRHVSFHEIVAAAQSVSDSVRKTLSTYKKLIQKYRQKKFLLQAYCSLLETLGNATEAAKCRYQMNKITQPQKRHVIEGVDFLQLDDPKSVLLVVQSSGVEAGLVLWAVNASVIGYSDEDIRGVDFNTLIPEAFRRQHQELLGDFVQKAETPLIFKKSLNLYFVTRQNQLVFGLFRVLLANLEPSGHLAFVVVLRTKTPPREFALITADNQIQERTAGFDRFCIETEFCKKARFSEQIVWMGTWRDQEVYVARSTWSIGTHLAAPVLTLYNKRLRKGIRKIHSTNCLVMSSSSIISIKKQDCFLGKATTGSQKTTSGLTTGSGGPRYSYTREIMKQNRPYLRILLVTTTAAFVLCMVLNLVLTNQVSSQHFILNQSIGEMQSLRMRTNSVVSSMRSKELFLLNAGYKVFTNENKSRTDLANIGKQMKEMAGFLLGNASRQTGEFRSLLLDPILPYWKYEMDRFNLYHMSLINIMIDIATHATTLAVIPLTNVTTDNPDFMTLYRNGAVEAMHAFNLSVKIFADQKNEERTEMEVTLQQILLAFMLFQIILSVTLTLPLLVFVERWRRLLWRLIVKMPKPLLAEMLNRIYDRLMSLHDCDDVTVSSEVENSQAFLQPSSYTMSFSMKKLIAAIIVFLLFINSSVFIVYDIGITHTEDILVNKPKYIHWAGLRRVIPWLSMYYMRESFLPANLSFSKIIKETQLPFSPLVNWKQAIDELVYLHRCLTYGCSESHLDKLFLSDFEKDLLAGNVCVNCSAYSRYGLTPLVYELAYGELAALSALSAGNSTYALSKTLEKEVSIVGPLLLDAVNRYDNDTLTQLDDAEKLTGYVCAIFVVAGFFVLVIAVAPLLHKNAELMRRELQILKNIESVDTLE